MSEKKPHWIAGSEFDVAFNLARTWHAEKSRKIGTTPYISHLMAVSALVVEHGGTQEQASAALLHDIIEDTQMSYERLRDLVGQEVADIVLACSDTEDKPSPDLRSDAEKKHDWVDRKTKYIAHIGTADDNDPSLLVALADKVHNSEQTARDIAALPSNDSAVAEFWAAFNAPRDLQHWWYGSLLNAFQQKPLPATLLQRFEAAVRIIQSK